VAELSRELLLGESHITAVVVNQETCLFF
jgi:hypothetical protein